MTALAAVLAAATLLLVAAGRSEALLRGRLQRPRGGPPSGVSPSTEGAVPARSGVVPARSGVVPARSGVVPAGLGRAPGVAAVARRRRAERTRTQVRDFAVLLAVKLRAGQSGRDAVARAARAAQPTGRAGFDGAGFDGAGFDGAGFDGAGFGLAVARAAETGGDVAAALARAGEQPGAEAMHRIAACWRVAERNGAGLAAAVGRVADGLHAEAAHRREVAAQLAGARSTGHLLAALPGFGLLLGAAFGARPWEFLLGTGVGRAVLACGLALDVLGIVWVTRIARAAEGLPGVGR